MGDLFDEFMRELERRRAEAEGRTPPRDPADPDAPAGDGDEPGRQDAPDDVPADRPAGDTPDEGTTAGSGEPTPIHRRSRPRSKGSASGGPPRAPRAKQPVGGPDDGAGRLTFRTILRRVGLVAAIVLVAFVVFLASAGIDLWTDAIWYQSVGFDSVFWTRIGVQVGPVPRRPGHRPRRPAVQPVARRAPRARRPIPRGRAGSARWRTA